MDKNVGDGDTALGADMGAATLTAETGWRKNVAAVTVVFGKCGAAMLARSQQEQHFVYSRGARPQCRCEHVLPEALRRSGKPGIRHARRHFA